MKTILILLLIGISVICNGQLVVNGHIATTKELEKEYGSNGKFTINLDGFKVTDTIWIQAGKRKTGVPAYYFLKFIKK
jgi:hypothetical protein